MKNLLITLSLACSAGLAFAHGCPKEMAAIDARMATNPKLSDADKAKVQKLRADGEAAHKAGKHDDSMKLLGQDLDSHIKTVQSGLQATSIP